jgi:DNA polymerase-3 subunit gamma/tau
VDIETIRRVWPDVVERLAAMRRVTWMMVRDHATVASFDGRRLLLTLGNPGVLANFRSGAHADFVQQALIDVLGVDARVDVTGDDATGSDATGSDASAPASDDRSAWPGVGASSAGSPSDAQGAPPRDGSRAHAPQVVDADTPAGSTEPEGWDSPRTDGARASGPDASGRTDDAAGTAAFRPAAVPAPVGPLLGAAGDEPSRDDEDAEDSGLVGRAVVEQLLGGQVIDETHD